MIGRREVITLLGGTAAWPLVARAQQSAVPMIGYMDTASASTTAHLVEAFRRGLGVAGYDEGRNVAIEYRWSEGDYDKLPALAAELVRHQVAVIATINTPTILAANAADHGWGRTDEEERQAENETVRHQPGRLPPLYPC